MVTHLLVTETKFLEIDAMTRHQPTTRSRLTRLAMAAGELARRLVGLSHVRAVYRCR